MFLSLTTVPSGRNKIDLICFLLIHKKFRVHKSYKNWGNTRYKLLSVSTVQTAFHKFSLYANPFAYVNSSLPNRYCFSSYGRVTLQSNYSMTFWFAIQQDEWRVITGYIPGMPRPLRALPSQISLRQQLACRRQYETRILGREELSRAQHFWTGIKHLSVEQFTNKIRLNYEVRLDWSTWSYLYGLARSDEQALCYSERPFSSFMMNVFLIIIDGKIRLVELGTCTVGHASRFSKLEKFRRRSVILWLTISSLPFSVLNQL